MKQVLASPLCALDREFWYIFSWPLGILWAWLGLLWAWLGLLRASSGPGWASSGHPLGQAGLPLGKEGKLTISGGGPCRF